MQEFSFAERGFNFTDRITIYYIKIMLSEIEQNILIGGKIRHGFRFPFGKWLEIEHRLYGKFSLCWFRSENRYELFLARPLLKYNAGWCAACEGFFIEKILSGKNIMLFRISKNARTRLLIFETNSGNVIATDSDGKILSSDNKRNKIGEKYSIPDDLSEISFAPKRPNESEIERILADGSRKFNFIEENFLRNEIFKRLKVEIKRTRKAIDAVLGDREKLGEPDKLQKLADAIMANIHNIPHRTDFAKIIDPYTNEPITVRLDPTISVQKNAERLYAKARKSRRGIEKVEVRIGELQAKLSELEKLSGSRDYRSVAQTLGIDISSILGEPVSISKPRKYRDYGSGIKKFVSSDGFVILVGRSADANNRLTFQVAAKDDIWLHAENIKGAHIVIKLAGAKDCPRRTLEQAASLAAFYSDAKHSDLVPVVYTRRRYVHSIKGKQGLVRLDRSETIFVKPKKL